ncbi:DUF6952 family protein [Chondrinema litorale]|uniref:DUF6952 family protein n=1 Tax=Chondrinema litorale TaxID=2994555 RepID=UPI002542D108|nr:hypothetical protein [Chondrinema litorale]UZR96170.1 hypothetical protein OQ292_10165 [Chondrinema litorale]
MRLPVIKHIHEFIKDHDQDYILEAVEVLEHITESEAIKDEELDVLGEMLSNMQGALEVRELMKQGKSEKEALNIFMKRVTGSIDR